MMVEVCLEIASKMSPCLCCRSVRIYTLAVRWACSITPNGFAPVLKHRTGLYSRQNTTAEPQHCMTDFPLQQRSGGGGGG